MLEVKIKEITDIKFFNKIKGIEKEISTHHIYEYICKDEEEKYIEKYIELKTLLSMKENSCEYFKEFSDFVETLDYWDEEIAGKIIVFYKSGYIA